MTNSVPFHCVFEDVAPIQFPLVNRFYKRSGYLVNCGRLEQVYCLRAIIDGVSSIIAAARFLPQTQESRYYLLRNLCVERRWRQRGLSRILMQNALEKLEQAPCYCFVQGYLQSFYESLGFVIFAQENVPSDIAKRYQTYSESQPGLLLLGFNG